MSTPQRTAQVEEDRGSCWDLNVKEHADWATLDDSPQHLRGVILRGSHFIKSWAATQKNVTLSSGEAELVAALAGLCQLHHEIHMPAFGIVHIDSTAALGVTIRRGNGRMRHVGVGQLWIQEKGETEKLKFQKVDGKGTPGDLFANCVPKKTLDVLYTNDELQC